MKECYTLFDKDYDEGYLGYYEPPRSAPASAVRFIAQS